MCMLINNWTFESTHSSFTVRQDWLRNLALPPKGSCRDYNHSCHLGLFSPQDNKTWIKTNKPYFLKVVEIFILIAKAKFDSYSIWTNVTVGWRNLYFGEYLYVEVHIIESITHPENIHNNPLLGKNYWCSLLVLPKNMSVVRQLCEVFRTSVKIWFLFWYIGISSWCSKPEIVESLFSWMNV